MEKHLSSLTVSIASCALLLMPASALAYLSPEQVFGTQQAPPTQREGEDVVEQQQQAAASSRAAAQESLVSIDDEPEDTYVPPANQSSSLGLFDDAAQYERRMERIEGENGGPTIIIGADGTVVDANGNVLHSGAKGGMTKTGPESVLALAAMVLAMLSTVAYAAIRSRRFQTAS